MTGVAAPTNWLDSEVWTGKVYVGGWKPATAGELTSFDPSTGEVLGTLGVSSVADVAEACRLAAQAQIGWAKVAPAERAAILRRAGELLMERQADVADWLARESGAAAPRAAFEIGASALEFEEAAKLTSTVLHQDLAPMYPGQVSRAERVPIGVVGVIAPWNAPLLLALRSMAPALALGNTVVLKADPETPVSGGVVLQQLMLDAGLPADALQVVFGGAEVGQALTTDPQVAMISFTGSTATGRIVARNAGEALKRVALELGGNNAFIVLDDADIDGAVSAALVSNFLGQGQGCICAGRHLVHESVIEEYTAKLVERASQLSMGNPSEQPVILGPIINARQHAHVVEVVEDSVAAGAQLLTGGPAEGLFYRASVLGGVRPGMRAYDEEIFGPVAPIVSISSDEEAVELANRSEYGLTAAVHSRSVERAQRIAEQLNTGMVHINDASVLDAPHVPFGGIRASGNGASFGTPANVEQFTHWRWTTVNEKVPDFGF